MRRRYRRSDIVQRMNWPQVIRDLRENGWTQLLLASRLGMPQSTLSELLNQKTVEPRYSVGLQMLELLASGEKPAKAAEQSAGSEVDKAAA